MSGPLQLELPEVSTSTADTIVVELAPRHAEVLAKIIAHYDSLTAEISEARVDGYVAEVWHRTLVDLLAQKASLGLRAPAVGVPLRRPPGVGPLRAVPDASGAGAGS